MIRIIFPLGHIWSAQSSWACSPPNRGVGAMALDNGGGCGSDKPASWGGRESVENKSCLEGGEQAIKHETHSI
jgi:hypothetical protein